MKRLKIEILSRASSVDNPPAIVLTSAQRKRLTDTDVAPNDSQKGRFDKRCILFLFIIEKTIIGLTVKLVDELN